MTVLWRSPAWSITPNISLTCQSFRRQNFEIKPTDSLLFGNTENSVNATGDIPRLVWYTSHQKQEPNSVDEQYIGCKIFDEDEEI